MAASRRSTWPTRSFHCMMAAISCYYCSNKGFDMKSWYRRGPSTQWTWPRAHTFRSNSRLERIGSMPTGRGLAERGLADGPLAAHFKVQNETFLLRGRARIIGITVTIMRAFVIHTLLSGMPKRLRNKWRFFMLQAGLDDSGKDGISPAFIL